MHFCINPPAFSPIQPALPPPELILSERIHLASASVPLVLTCPPQLQLHLYANSKLAAAVQLQLRRHGLLVGRVVLDIDIPSKKVTVVGDVTPLGVLTSVSKVKPAQFWPSQPCPPRTSASF
ncbi:hypothetical protein CFC21_047445 [Triticum aestivum]|uniref:HMA domain-containing protein n=3 Tax=Triticinae TaxID=1648030 RepID=A0A9R1FX90_WHEAT|nr:hypothetical protein CFC21_047441 [Triticum aestivum]KAF7036937.1 hypothetical protein CFC21_047445 [Triticum aestivum]